LTLKSSFHSPLSGEIADPTEAVLGFDDDLVAGRNVVAVELFVGVFHLFWCHQIAIALVDVVEAHLAGRQSEELLQAGFEIEDFPAIETPSVPNPHEASNSPTNL
jgi:hypothetical protein